MFCSKSQQWVTASRVKLQLPRDPVISWLELWEWTGGTEVAKAGLGIANAAKTSSLSLSLTPCPRVCFHLCSIHVSASAMPKAQEIIALPPHILPYIFWYVGYHKRVGIWVSWPNRAIKIQTLLSLKFPSIFRWATFTVKPWPHP